MGTPDCAGACQYALHQLQANLSPQLYYHSVAHTRGDVVPAAERLADLAALSDHARMLLVTAAWFHDLGFVERREGHELASARIAAAALPSFGYPPGQVAAIERMIMATRLPQSPQTPLEMLLADADLDSLGRPDFLQTSLALRAELQAYGAPIGLRDWFARQRQFLLKHRYFSAEARMLRDVGKRQNIEKLARLSECPRDPGVGER